MAPRMERRAFFAACCFAWSLVSPVLQKYRGEAHSRDAPPHTQPPPLHTLALFMRALTRSSCMQALLDGTRVSINGLAGAWTPEEKQACMEETPATFKWGGALVGLIQGGEPMH